MKPALELTQQFFLGFYARLSAPGRSCSNSNFEVCPGFPVADLFGAGLAAASLALMAFSFFVLFTPSFFFRCL
jgi:hypothetical protein